MSGQTGRGFWYPEGDDPITDYPALAALLAAEIEDEFDEIRALSQAVRASFSNSAYTYLQFDAGGLIDELAGWGPGVRSYFTVPEAGDYAIAFVGYHFSGSGSGNIGIGVDRYNPAGSVKQEDVCGNRTDYLNGVLSAHGITRAGALDRLYFGAFNNPSGSAGTMFLRASIVRI